MIRKITADTNVYISALNFGGVPEKILTLAQAGVFELAISAAILSEVERVLTVKFHWVSGLLREALLEIAGYTVRIRPTEKLNVVWADPTDNRILECAIQAGSDCIVSGDKHLLHLDQYAGIPILRPSEFLDLLWRERSIANLPRL